MLRQPPKSTRTDTLFPYTTLFRSADLFVRPVADREIGPPLRICRGDRPVRLADRKAPPGLVVAEGGPCAMHAERVARLGRRRRMAGCHNPPGDRTSTRLNSRHQCATRMPSSA